ncbi:hypothetical protein A374_05256 [Fictibacillus macauensis ZFHKF-1]|uniref:DUF218 domain-containing protein n=1 Tax=Fictibacillus macauensis ZFHKF-1 TaxID=1196324 RepID=I8UHG0_9BACL|nr:YdcF family protein [Fictibacillus macauensis]EIT86345.1 hypothetical protein A374_05256 [Fictibacillus macauensis ZFHKF-1]
MILASIALEAFILSSINNDQPSSVDYVLILGAGLKNDKPTPVLKERLNTAIAYYKKHPHTTLVTSGGLTKGDHTSEGEAMAQYLVMHGVPKKDIVQETKSKSTSENIAFASKLMKKRIGNHKHHVLLVSNDFHLKRAKMLASKEGVIPYGLGASTPLPVIPQVHVREILALAKYFLFE